MGPAASRRSPLRRALAGLLLALPSMLCPLILTGCPRAPDPSEVVVYCAHDREFADEVLRDFAAEAGVRVVPRYDTEKNKSVGLYQDLIQEAGKPRCDVHWNNEILATLRLHAQGILEPYASPSAEPFPAPYRAKDHAWTAFAARARVLLVNTERIKDRTDWPKGLWDLTGPKWKGKVAMARPQFGTTATQAACLFQVWGEAEAKDFYRKLHANEVEIVPGNKQVAVGVGRGQFAVGLTDTDDAFAELDAGNPVAIVYPDRDAPEGGRRGTLFIPNTVAMIKRCPHPEAARKLIDYLLSPEVEARLARSKSRQIPLNPRVKIELPKHLETPQTVRALPVDFAAAAGQWQQSQAFLVEEFALR